MTGKTAIDFSGLFEGHELQQYAINMENEVKEIYETLRRIYPFVICAMDTKIQAKEVIDKYQHKYGKT